MLRRIPFEVEEEILGRLLKGDSFRQISVDHDVSLATISRVLHDARRRAPDIDKLIKLSIRLKKVGSTVFDAMRGCRLLEELNKYGMSPKELQYYIILINEYFSDKGLDDEFIEYAVRLKQLEQTCGKSYKDITKDFDKMISENAKLKAKNNALKKDKQELKNDHKYSKEKIRELGEDYARIMTEIEETLTTQKTLKNIGIEKLATMAKFIQMFELLGFNADEVQKLALLKKSLEEVNIIPEKLKQYIEEKGPLDAQATDLRRTVGILRDETESLRRRKKNFVDENSKFFILDEILTTRRMNIPCKTCGLALPITLKTREEYEAMIRNGLVDEAYCPRCGPQLWDLREIVGQLGWILLPTGDYIIPINKYM